MVEVALVIAVLGVVGLGILLWRAVGARADAERRMAAVEAERAAATAAAARAAEGERSAREELEATRREVRQVEANLSEMVAEGRELRAKLDAAEERAQQAMESAVREYRAELAKVRELAEQRVAAAEEVKRRTEQALKEGQESLKNIFDASAGRALKEVSEQFVKQAGETLKAASARSESEIEAKRTSIDAMVREVREKLAGTAQALEKVQTDWAGQRSALGEQLRSIGAANDLLRAETGKLVKALREPTVRGRYGEIQLRRVAELAGMRSYCDFAEQDSTTDDDGNLLRPDMVVRLPNGRELVVDAKANLKPYIDAMEAETPEEAERYLVRFADGIAEQARALSKKNYWHSYDGSPEFVVMFVPGDQFVDAALSRRPDLLEAAASHGVLLVSPCSLIGMLRAVAVGFQERVLSEKAGEMAGDVKELADRLAVAVEHLEGVGSALASSVERYNQFVGSYQLRVLPQVRKIEASGVQPKKSVSQLPSVEVQPRPLNKTALPAPGGQGMLDGLR